MDLIFKKYTSICQIIFGDFWLVGWFVFFTFFVSFFKGDLKGRAEMLNIGIRIRNVTRKDSGEYRCEVSAPGKQAQDLAEATITLTVLGRIFNFTVWVFVERVAGRDNQCQCLPLSVWGGFFRHSLC